MIFVTMKERTCTVCDGRLHEAEEITRIHEGAIYEFCSSEHKKEFDRMAERYA